ncbi:hypothetical protein SMAC4_13795 [Sordaria macrospora]|uniref:uncharacterized protein n=1 Tax=Sordaria macrospora TaxID=5147 RepID=UPI002B2DBD92|nr:hypothetical protein SMAC4_13795 [Sordaria macrospora]
MAAQPRALVNHGDALAKILLEPDRGVGTTGAGADDGDINVNDVLSRARGQYRGRRGGSGGNSRGSRQQRCCNPECGGSHDRQFRVDTLQVLEVLPNVVTDGWRKGQLLSTCMKTWSG